MNRKYMIRLDDACPTMDTVKWQRIEDMLDATGVRPMVGVIPHNEDAKQQVEEENPFFWNIVDRWINKQWVIALHGYNHCYTSDKGLKGLNPLWSRSEFSGLPLVEQKEKIRNGVKILREHGIDPQYFFAPSHTFDENTLVALREESNIRVISDTIATEPYRMGDFTIIPQLGGHCFDIKIPGIWTFCFHPNTMDDKSFSALEYFLLVHKNEFISFCDIDTKEFGKKSLFSKLLSFVYFSLRKFRGIK